MRTLVLLFLGLAGLASPAAGAGVLPRQKLLDAQTFWDNRDWDWYKANVPFFECPDADVTTTYYYRWELVTKHLTYGSPASGYSFTEFIDRPFWSGTYGAISCPAGLQLYEVRWLRDPRYARDYSRYWFRTPGAQPRRYSTWLADAVWAAHCVHPDEAFVKDLLPDLVRNYRGWEERHFVRDVGLFWQTGHDDGMEYNINSRQTTDTVRGAPGYRPTLNAYLWADALAIAEIADLKGEAKLAASFRDRAAALKDNLQKKLWDPKRQFFFPMARRDETANGHTVKALSLTYQTGRFAGSRYGRELIGYVPWQFGLPDGRKGYEAAWKKLTAKDGFAARFGPTTVERNDPLFKISPTCCWWSGNSWPYATAQTLKALANLLQNHDQDAVTKADYLDLLTTYARTHRKKGKPYVAEACHPDTGSWEGHDAYNHSEHYFHSNYCDLVITGLVGLVVRADDTLELKPLAPASWDYFALDNLLYRGRNLAVLWDRTGKRYGKGAGLRVLADGKEIAFSDKLGPVKVQLPPAARKPAAGKLPVNYAVNNDGGYYPRAFASATAPGTSVTKLADGNYWYHRSPPNRWVAGPSKAGDYCGVDFGVARPAETVKLYFLDDEGKAAVPARYEIEFWDGKGWKAVPKQTRTPEEPAGRRANVVRFPRLETAKLRVTLTRRGGLPAGLTEFEAWGPAEGEVAAAPLPAGNLAYNPTGKGFPRVTASFSDRFGSSPQSAFDGKVSFNPSPFNRWTSYESPNTADWLAVDFGGEKKVSRVELGIYDDRGGVQPPSRYDVEYWDGKRWAAVRNARKVPEAPAGGEFNEVRFDPVSAPKIRIVFINRGKARSGVTEVLMWSD